MHPDKVKRETTKDLTDLPNIGSSLAKELQLIGIKTPQQLTDCDPVELYESLCKAKGKRQDPCVLDVFMSVTDFMNGSQPKVWWKYTAERKQMMKK